MNMNKIFNYGDKLMWAPMDDPFHNEYECIVCEVGDLYAIARTFDGMRLWIDEDNIEEFKLNGFRLILMED